LLACVLCTNPKLYWFSLCLYVNRGIEKWKKYLPKHFSIINDKNHQRSSVPCLQTSLYRSLWVEYQVHWPLITGHPSGLGSHGSCKVYWSLFTDSPKQVPSLPISHYRLFLIRKMEKNIFQVTFFRRRFLRPSLEYLPLFSDKVTHTKLTRVRICVGTRSNAFVRSSELLFDGNVAMEQFTLASCLCNIVSTKSYFKWDH